MPPPSPPRKTSPPQRNATSPKAPNSAGAAASSKKPPPPPSKTASASSMRTSPRGGRGGKGAAAGAGSKKRGEQAMLEIINNETLARQTVIQDYFVDISAFQIRYEAEGKRAKDSYISILERRLAQAHAAARIRVDAMEEKFQAILTSISRLLVDTYHLGAMGITDGVVMSDMSPAPTSSLGVGGASSLELPGGGGASPVGPSLTTRGSAGSAARIASPFSLGGAASPATSSTMATPRPQQQGVVASPLLSDNEEKIRRFFINPQTPETTKLEVIDVREFCARVDELRDGVTGLVSQCVTKLSTSIYRVKNLEHALDDQSLCLASAERLLQNSIVKSDNANQSAIQLCRSLGSEVQEKWTQLSSKLIGTLDHLIRDTVDTCLDHQESQKRREIVKAFNYRSNENSGTSSSRTTGSSSSVAAAAVAATNRAHELDKELLVTDFSSDLSGICMFQSDILRTIREKILKFQRNMMQDHVLEHAKLFRSNIPEEYRRVLHCCEMAFDRSALLQVLDRVSFEPAAAEIIIAVTEAFVDANGGMDVVEELIMTRPGDDSVVPPPPPPAPLLQDNPSASASFEGTSQLLRGSGGVGTSMGSAGSARGGGMAVAVRKDSPTSPLRRSPPPTIQSAKVPGSADAKKKMLYAQALNSVAFTTRNSSGRGGSTGEEDDDLTTQQSLEKLSPRSFRAQRQHLYGPLSSANRKDDSSTSHLHKNDGVLSQGIGLSTAVNRLKAGLANKHQQQPQAPPHRSPLHFVPVSEILNPSSSVDVYPNRVHTLVNHPEAVGVVASAHRMFVPSFTRGYVSSVVKERMELEKTMRGVVEERQSELEILKGGGVGKHARQHGEDPPHVVRLLPSMTPGIKRRVLLDILSSDDGIVTTNNNNHFSSSLPPQHGGGGNPLVPQRPGSSPLKSNGGGEESAQVVVTSRLSARFTSSASLKRDRDVAAAQQQQATPSALDQRPRTEELEALGIRRAPLAGSDSSTGVNSSQPRPMPAAARLYSEKQRSLLQQLLECDGESTGAAGALPTAYR
ncbi:Hypothetical protein, putative [Bodo saltans]|uniref:Uncharacterized protein n=1 Tax=Bodo saltans TaxID=75058 RepID=A0A0S4JZ00_BODSA|nr:Hypothetical protein, putative [Bodo saltans]|eukprot:CUG93807.1 Hypothetical protein, putative [Bodo saltans]